MINMDSIAIKNEIKQKILERIEERLGEEIRKDYDEMDFDELITEIYYNAEDQDSLSVIAEAIRFNPNLIRAEKDYLLEVIDRVSSNLG